MTRAVLVIEREDTSDIFGHYDFKIMSIRFETKLDKFLTWCTNYFRRKIDSKDIKELGIFNIRLPKELACVLNVVPTPALCRFLYKLKTKEDNE